MDSGTGASRRQGAIRMNLGWGEITLIVLVVLLLFGAKRLPDLARSLGRSLGEFKKGKMEGSTPESAGGKAHEEKTSGQSGTPV